MIPVCTSGIKVRQYDLPESLDIEFHSTSIRTLVHSCRDRRLQRLRRHRHRRLQLRITKLTLPRQYVYHGVKNQTRSVPFENSRLIRSPRKFRVFLGLFFRPHPHIAIALGAKTNIAVEFVRVLVDCRFAIAALIAHVQSHIRHGLKIARRLKA